MLLSLLLPAVLLTTVSSGCKKSTPEDEEAVRPNHYEKTDIKEPPGGKVEPLKAGDGSIIGRIVYDGTPPEMSPIGETMKAHKDAAGCLAGTDIEQKQQTWIIGKDNAVENVVVFLDPGKKFFDQLKDEDKDRSKQTVEVDQPHCAFIPHVVAVYPSWWNGQKLEPTNQKFVVPNKANFTHNLKWAGNPAKNPSGSVTLAPGDKKDLTLRPKDIVTLGCDVHPWMQGKVYVFNHPYHAVTREPGTFEIKNVPTGVDVNLVFWHEAKGEFKKDTIKLMAGEKKDLGDVKLKQ